MALHMARRACEQAPDNHDFLSSLGVAQYRVGHYEDALTTLLRSDEFNGGTRPADVAFIAMSQHALGRIDDAKTTFERLRELMNQEQWKNDDEDRAFLNEAAQVLGVVEDPASQPSQDAIDPGPQP